MSVNPLHFQVLGGRLSPQPWMQWRRVAGGRAAAVSRVYGVTGGGAKNDRLQTVSVKWTNNTPISQRLYGLVTHGGSSVVLQARSRGYLRHDHTFGIGTTPAMAEDVSRFGGGADLGQGGIIGIGTGYGIHAVHGQSRDMPLMPHLTGWLTVPAGVTVTARVDVRFVSDFWETNVVDGGDSATESQVISGEVQVSLFAVPVIGTPPPRQTPTIVGTSVGLASADPLAAKPIIVAKPAGVAAGDTLVAIAGNQWGTLSALSAPDASWRELAAVGGGPLDGIGRTHLKVWTKQAGQTEPDTYSFGNPSLAEGIATLIAVRGAAPVGGDAESPGWAAATRAAKWSESVRHDAPSITRPGQLLLAAVFIGRTDDPRDTAIGPTPIQFAAPTGMSELQQKHGMSASMCVAALTGPPNPSRVREFPSTPHAFFSDMTTAVSIVVPGRQSLE